jgi:hypothetical protein
MDHDPTDNRKALRWLQRYRMSACRASKGPRWGSFLFVGFAFVGEKRASCLGAFDVCPKLLSPSHPDPQEDHGAATQT